MKKVENAIFGTLFLAISLIATLVYMAFLRIDYISQEQLATTPTDVHELLEEEMHLRKTLNAFGYAVLEANELGEITKWDEIATAMWGYTSREALGQQVEFLMAEKVKSDHKNGFFKALHKGSGIVRDAACEFARHKEGYLFSVQVEIRVLSVNRVVALVKLV